jgi:signal peptidase I
MKKKFVVLAVFLFFALILLLYALILYLPHGAVPGCEIHEIPVTVNGDSMAPLIQNGRNLTAGIGYYACNPVNRGDVILYNFSGSSNLLIKTIRAIPGDHFSLEKIDGVWRIVVNNETLKNSEGIGYGMDDSVEKMLALYVEDYKGVIPENSFLILGDNPFGGVDSRSFGLVDIQDIKGKIRL